MLQSWINRTFVFWWRHSKSADRLNDWNYINDWNQPQLLFGLIQFWLFDMQMSWVTCNSLFLRGPRYPRCATFQTGTWRHMQIICQLYANEFDRFVAFNRIKPKMESANFFSDLPVPKHDIANNRPSKGTRMQIICKWDANVIDFCLEISLDRLNWKTWNWNDVQ